MRTHATAIAVFKTDPTREPEVRAWQAELDAAAASWPGFIESQVTVDNDPREDRAAAVTFDSERHLRAWLDSPDRAGLIRRGRELGVSDSAATIVLVQGERPPSGVGVFVHQVAPGHEAGFVQIERALREAGRIFPGFLGGILLPPGNVRGLWVSIARFDSDQGLAFWLASDVRRDLLDELRPHLSADFEQYTRNAPFGSIVRFDGAAAKVTAKWRVAMIVLLVLYPTVMLLARFLSPLLAEWGMDPGLTLWFGNLASTVLLTWLLMPGATWAFRKWLDPGEGAGLRATITGAIVILVLYGVTLAVFLSVRELQYWDS